MSQAIFAYGMGGLLSAFVVFAAGDMLLRAWRNTGMLQLLDRWDVVNRLVTVVFFCVVALVAIQWSVFPVAAWYVFVPLVAAAFGGAALRWPDLPWSAQDGRARGRRISSLVFGPVVAVVCVAAAVL